MDAIILVGGQGTRLRPLTLTRHKSLVPVCNRPAIAYLFEWIARFGFDREAEKLVEIGERLGVSAERVRQIEERALAKLRQGV